MIKQKQMTGLGSVKVSLGEDQFAPWDTEFGAWKWTETVRCDSGNIAYRNEGVLL